jgi:hypothetical protein
MGEAKRRQLAVQTQALRAMTVDTPGGRIHVQWDHGASATPNAQLTFFAEFLATTGLRGDAVSPQILGMQKIISEDALRRSLSRMNAQQSQAWLVPQLLGSVHGALGQIAQGGHTASCRQNRFGAESKNQERAGRAN